MAGGTFFSQSEHQSSFSYDESPVESLLDQKTVFLTPLPSVPGTTVTKYLGPVYIHLVKNSDVTRSVSRVEGATEEFFFLFLSEAGAVARAQVKALGGNTLLGYKINMQDGGHGSSGLYNMITVSGDAVTLEQDSSHCRSYWKAIHSKEMQRRDEWLTCKPQQK